jgi:hypothetical protein
VSAVFFVTIVSSVSIAEAAREEEAVGWRVDSLLYAFIALHADRASQSALAKYVVNM